MLRARNKVYFFYALLTNTKTHKFYTKTKCADIMGINNGKSVPTVSFGNEKIKSKKAEWG